ncbi:unnamed protein product [Closterium sp. NIES-64]|nr:unnamed protein product [Closterium sp. NIES-64]
MFSAHPDLHEVETILSHRDTPRNLGAVDQFLPLRANVPPPSSPLPSPCFPHHTTSPRSAPSPPPRLPRHPIALPRARYHFPVRATLFALQRPNHLHRPLPRLPLFCSHFFPRFPPFLARPPPPLPIPSCPSAPHHRADPIPPALTARQTAPFAPIPFPYKILSAWLLLPSPPPPLSTSPFPRPFPPLPLCGIPTCPRPDPPCLDCRGSGRVECTRCCGRDEVAGDNVMWDGWMEWWAQLGSGRRGARGHPIPCWRGLCAAGVRGSGGGMGAWWTGGVGEEGRRRGGGRGGGQTRWAVDLGAFGKTGRDGGREGRGGGGAGAYRPRGPRHAPHRLLAALVLVLQGQWAVLLCVLHGHGGEERHHRLPLVALHPSIARHLLCLPPLNLPCFLPAAGPAFTPPRLPVRLCRTCQLRLPRARPLRPPCLGFAPVGGLHSLPAVSPSDTRRACPCHLPCLPLEPAAALPYLPAVPARAARRACPLSLPPLSFELVASLPLELAASALCVL